MFTRYPITKFGQLEEEIRELESEGVPLPFIVENFLGKDGDNGQSFRLNKISEIQKFLEDEVRIRDNLAKKFMKYSKTADNIESGLTIVAIGAGAGGIALLST